MFEITLLLSLRVETYVGSMIWKLCISHVFCLIFALYTYILLIFSSIRMKTRNWNWCMTQRWKVWKRCIGEKRRASFNTTCNWGVLCGPWRWVLHTNVSLLYYWVLLFIMYHRTIWMKIAYPSRFDFEADKAPELVLSVWWSENYLTLPWKGPWINFTQLVIKSISSVKHKLICQNFSLHLNA